MTVTYWGVLCECGQFQALKQIISPADGRKPNMRIVTFICSHRSGDWVKPQQLGPDELIRRALPESIKGFRPYPDFV
jgi:hypothetical protein